MNQSKILWNQIKNIVTEHLPNIDFNEIDSKSYLYGRNLFSDDDYLYIACSPFKDDKVIEYGGSFYKKNVKIFYSSYKEFKKAFSQYKKDVDFFLQNKSTQQISQFNTESIKTKLEEIYQAQEKHYELMMKFEKEIRGLVKANNLPYPDLTQIIGTYGDGIENVDLAMTEFEQEMERIGFEWNDEMQEEEGKER